MEEELSSAEDVVLLKVVPLFTVSLTTLVLFTAGAVEFTNVISFWFVTEDVMFSAEVFSIWVLEEELSSAEDVVLLLSGEILFPVEFVAKAAGQ